MELHKLEAVIAGDLKIINILLGIMGHSSNFPWPYCISPKLNLQMENREARTLGSLSAYFKIWKDEGAEEKRAKLFLTT